MLVHRNFVSSSRASPLHLLFLFGLFAMVAVQAFPIETVASSSTSPPPALVPASAAQFDVGRPSEPPTSELQEVAESDQLLLGYVFVTKSVGKRFKQGDKKVWEETMRRWTWWPEGYRIHPRPLIPKSPNNQPSVLSRFKLFKSTDDYDMSRNQWTCKVNFRSPKEVLAQIKEVGLILHFILYVFLRLKPARTLCLNCSQPLRLKYSKKTSSLMTFIS
ncbi:hypothetical protein F5880DRAFT_1587930 [Lentinula raphanica]|nr:hypothetical protein F5880DRAFT_1587930 [Lentinula raphanica]